MANPRNRDLEAKLFKLFQDEKLRSKDDVTRLFGRHLGFTYTGTPLPARSDEFWGEGQVAELVERESFEILAQAGNARLGGFAIIYGTLRDFNLSNQRAIILQLRKTFRDALYIFAKPQTLDRSEGAQLHIVHAKVRAAGAGADASRLILRRLRFGPGERYRTTAERLAKLDLNAQKFQSATAITALCNQAFDKEALTSEFFKKLDQHIKAIEIDLRENQHLDGPQAFSEAQLLIERLIFLYFAQNRGWLNQTATYLLDHFAPYRKDGDGFGYYEDFLHLLFHTLAEQSFGNRLQGIPFLNGGLFNDDEFKLPSSKLRIRNATFASLFDDLLEAYNFTVREDTPLSQEVAVDPEMLGKVFESIVLHAESAGEEYQAPDKRKATGSYYTPRIVVHFICRESLRLYLAQRAQVLADSAQRNTWGERISRLFKEIDPTDGFSEEELKILKAVLSPSEAKRCLECLRVMRTLDPAVGSGAFPVGLLHELVSLQRIFETAEKGYQDPVKGSGTQWMQKAKEYFIEHALFGVDIQQQAIEICRLRLWLSLLVDYELGVIPFEAERSAFITAINRISQLPNLEMNFKRGDSLHDFICDHPVRIEPQTTTQYADDLGRIEKLGTKLHKAIRGNTKKTLRLEILEKRIELAQRIVRDEIKILSDRSFNLSADWFGAGLSDKEKSNRLDEEIARLQKGLKQLERDETNLRKLKQQTAQKAKDFYRKLRELEGSEMDGPINFAWRIDFPHVLSGAPNETLLGEFALVNQAQRQQELTAGHKAKADSGFDLIVGNPPFVTARNAEKRELYRERWPLVCYMKYLLLCPFVQMSFGLLRNNGQLGFILSNAFTKRDFGKPLVEKFFPTVDLQKIIDCSGLMFPGHGTPTCLVFGRLGTTDSERLGKEPIRNLTILPGGGDLRTPPEESALWHNIAAHHDAGGLRSETVPLEPDVARRGFRKRHEDLQIAVGDCDRVRMLTHPCMWCFVDWPVFDAISSCDHEILRDLLVDDIGFMFVMGRNEIFVHSADAARRLHFRPRLLKPLTVGEDVRDWKINGVDYALFPYAAKSFELLKFKPNDPEMQYFDLFETELASRPTFSGTFEEAGRVSYQYHQLPINRAKNPRSITFSEIATHAHFAFDPEGRAYNQKAPLLKLNSAAGSSEHCLLLGILNSAAALFWLKQICFSRRESEEAESDTYYEFRGERLEQFPVPRQIAISLRGSPTELATHVTALAQECSDANTELQSLPLRKLFEKSGEAYHAWNSSLPGHVMPHKELGAPFSSTKNLQQRLVRAQQIREKLRGEMIARQEEMDWLVYEAYGIWKDTSGASELKQRELMLEREERPFRLWVKAAGDFDKAVALIPTSWTANKKKLWRTRLEAIRDNEHIRRIEQPVYKRRWDEQWKVGNRWECGPAAYAQELIDAFTWWLSEKAEWHLERKVKGGPLALQDWSATLFKDARVAAAWPVIAGAIYEVEKYKFDALDAEKKETRRKPKRDDSYTAFERFFREIILDQSVTGGIPAAVPWDELAGKKKWAPAQLKKAQAVRGKLNVPRERFQQVSSANFIWAGTTI